MKPNDSVAPGAMLLFHPALAMTYGFGILLLATPGAVDWRQGWIWLKLALVAAQEELVAPSLSVVAQKV